MVLYFRFIYSFIIFIVIIDIGRRLAELELKILLTKVFHHVSLHKIAIYMSVYVMACTHYYGAQY